jgi:hypothetical protein
MDEENFGEVQVDEADFRALKRLKTGDSTIVLENTGGKDVDGEALAAHFAALPGIEKIESLTVDPTSRLRDLGVVKGFPNLLNLQVNGLQLRTLDGLEWFRKGRFLNVDTGKNKRRDLSKLQEAPIHKLTLQYAKEEDFDAIAGSRTLGHLQLGGSPLPSFGEWKKVPLESLGLSSGSFKELADTAGVASLRKLTLIGCRNLEKVAGDNGKVTWLVLTTCGKLDLRTLRTFSGLKSLVVVANAKKCPLSAFAELRELENLSFDACQVPIDLRELGAALPRLKELHHSELKEDEARRLSEASPGVTISTARQKYRDGAPMKG